MSYLCFICNEAVWVPGLSTIFRFFSEYSKSSFLTHRIWPHSKVMLLSITWILATWRGRFKAHPESLSVASYQEPVLRYCMYTLPTDEIIGNRNLLKVCFDGFTCGIKNTGSNQHNILWRITIRAMFNRKPCYFKIFPKSSFSISFCYQSFKMSYSVGTQVIRQLHVFVSSSLLPLYR